MGTALIITEKCRGLYKPGDGTVRECEHPVSHLPECGPDPIARPYTPAPEPEAGPASEAFTVRVLDYIGASNAPGHHPSVSPVTAASLLTLAILYDRHQQPVSAEEIAAVLGNAPSTVARQLRECTIIRHLRGRRYEPEPTR